ncbi:hypothetical protein EVAR_48000_1 [Eumeta japonica]|uniref:Uncharacterized protein n=1 Tax=Eumeta variegata TaxID=151549 RepID=A0A4C1XRV8_EUMVA|nr:hypothetical protein EVAR_48000_1 [Eumeta japonica]
MVTWRDAEIEGNLSEINCSGRRGYCPVAEICRDSCQSMQSNFFKVLHFKELSYFLIHANLFPCLSAPIESNAIVFQGVITAGLRSDLILLRSKVRVLSRVLFGFEGRRVSSISRVPDMQSVSMRIKA